MKPYIILIIPILLFGCTRDGGFGMAESRVWEATASNADKAAHYRRIGNNYKADIYDPVGAERKRAENQKQLNEMNKTIIQHYKKCIYANIGKYKNVKIPPYDILNALNGDCPREYMGINLITEDDPELKKLINNDIVNKIVKTQYGLK